MHIVRITAGVFFPRTVAFGAEGLGDDVVEEGAVVGDEEQGAGVVLQRRFEELCAAYYEALGYTAEISQSRADGAIDIGLCAAGADKAAIIVHCQPWNAYRVGIKHKACQAADAVNGRPLASQPATELGYTF